MRDILSFFLCDLRKLFGSKFGQPCSLSNISSRLELFDIVLCCIEKILFQAGSLQNSKTIYQVQKLLPSQSRDDIFVCDDEDCQGQKVDKEEEEGVVHVIDCQRFKPIEIIKNHCPE